MCKIPAFGRCIISDSLGPNNRTSRLGRLDHGHSFSHSSGAGRPRSGSRRGPVLLRPLFRARRPSRFIAPTPCPRGWREKTSSLPHLLRARIPHGPPPSWPPLHPTTSRRPQLQGMLLWGVRALTYKLGETRSSPQHMARLCSGFGTPSFPLSAMAEQFRLCLHQEMFESHPLKVSHSKNVCIPQKLARFES